MSIVKGNSSFKNSLKDIEVKKLKKTKIAGIPIKESKEDLQDYIYEVNHRTVVGYGDLVNGKTYTFVDNYDMSKFDFSIITSGNNIVLYNNTESGDVIKLISDDDGVIGIVKDNKIYYYTNHHSDSRRWCIDNNGSISPYDVPENITIEFDSQYVTEDSEDILKLILATPEDIRTVKEKIEDFPNWEWETTETQEIIPAMKEGTNRYKFNFNALDYTDIFTPDIRKDIYGIDSNLDWEHQYIDPNGNEWYGMNVSSSCLTVNFNSKTFVFVYDISDPVNFGSWRIGNEQYCSATIDSPLATQEEMDSCTFVCDISKVGYEIADEYKPWYETQLKKMILNTDGTPVTTIENGVTYKFNFNIHDYIEVFEASVDFENVNEGHYDIRFYNGSAMYESIKFYFSHISYPSLFGYIKDSNDTMHSYYFIPQIGKYYPGQWYKTNSERPENIIPAQDLEDVEFDVYDYAIMDKSIMQRLLLRLDGTKLIDEVITHKEVRTLKDEIENGEIAEKYYNTEYETVDDLVEGKKYCVRPVFDETLTKEILESCHANVNYAYSNFGNWQTSNKAFIRVTFNNKYYYYDYEQETWIDTSTNPYSNIEYDKDLFSFEYSAEYSKNPDLLRKMILSYDDEQPVEKKKIESKPRLKDKLGNIKELAYETDGTWYTLKDSIDWTTLASMLESNYNTIYTDDYNKVPYGYRSNCYYTTYNNIPCIVFQNEGYKNNQYNYNYARDYTSGSGVLAYKYKANKWLETNYCNYLGDDKPIFQIRDDAYTIRRDILELIVEPYEKVTTLEDVFKNIDSDIEELKAPLKDKIYDNIKTEVDANTFDPWEMDEGDTYESKLKYDLDHTTMQNLIGSNSSNIAHILFYDWDNDSFGMYICNYSWYSGWKDDYLLFKINDTYYKYQLYHGSNGGTFEGEWYKTKDLNSNSWYYIDSQDGMPDMTNIEINPYYGDLKQLTEPVTFEEEKFAAIDEYYEIDEEPPHWDLFYRSYYRYDEDSDSYVRVDDNDAPDFSSDTFYYPDYFTLSDEPNDWESNYYNYYTYNYNINLITYLQYVYILHQQTLEEKFENFTPSGTSGYLKDKIYDVSNNLVDGKEYQINDDCSGFFTKFSDVMGMNIIYSEHSVDDLEFDDGNTFIAAGKSAKIDINEPNAIDEYILEIEYVNESGIIGRDGTGVKGEGSIELPGIISKINSVILIITNLNQYRLFAGETSWMSRGGDRISVKDLPKLKLNLNYVKNADMLKELISYEQTLEDKIKDLPNWTYDEDGGSSELTLEANKEYTLKSTIDMSEFSAGLIYDYYAEGNGGGGGIVIKDALLTSDTPTRGGAIALDGGEAIPIGDIEVPSYDGPVVAESIRAFPYDNDGLIIVINNIYGNFGSGWMIQGVGAVNNFQIKLPDIDDSKILNKEALLKLISVPNAKSMTLKEKLNEPLKDKIYEIKKQTESVTSPIYDNLSLFTDMTDTGLAATLNNLDLMPGSDSTVDTIIYSYDDMNTNIHYDIQYVAVGSTNTIILTYGITDISKQLLNNYINIIQVGISGFNSYWIKNEGIDISHTAMSTGYVDYSILPTGDPVNSQDELPNFVIEEHVFDVPTEQYAIDYSDYKQIVEKLISNFTREIIIGQQTLGEKIADLKNWAYETKESGSGETETIYNIKNEVDWDGLSDLLPSGEWIDVYNNDDTHDYLAFYRERVDDEIQIQIQFGYNRTQYFYYNFPYEMHSGSSVTGYNANVWYTWWIPSSGNGGAINMDDRSYVPVSPSELPKNIKLDSNYIISEYADALPMLFDITEPSGGVEVEITTLEDKIKDIKHWSWEEIGSEAEIVDGETYTLPTNYDMTKFTIPNNVDVVYGSFDNPPCALMFNGGIGVMVNDHQYSYTNEGPEEGYCWYIGNSVADEPIEITIDKSKIVEGKEDILKLILGLESNKTVITIEDKLADIKNWAYNVKPGTIDWSMFDDLTFRSNFIELYFDSSNQESPTVIEVGKMGTMYNLIIFINGITYICINEDMSDNGFSASANTWYTETQNGIAEATKPELEIDPAYIVPGMEDYVNALFSSDNVSITTVDDVIKNANNKKVNTMSLSFRTNINWNQFVGFETNTTKGTILYSDNTSGMPDVDNYRISLFANDSSADDGLGDYAIVIFDELNEVKHIISNRNLSLSDSSLDSFMLSGYTRAIDAENASVVANQWAKMYDNGTGIVYETDIPTDIIYMPEYVNNDLLYNICDLVSMESTVGETIYNIESNIHTLFKANRAIKDDLSDLADDTTQAITEMTNSLNEYAKETLKVGGLELYSNTTNLDQYKITGTKGFKKNIDWTAFASVTTDTMIYGDPDAVPTTGPVYKLWSEYMGTNNAIAFTRVIPNGDTGAIDMAYVCYGGTGTISIDGKTLTRNVWYKKTFGENNTYTVSAEMPPEIPDAFFDATLIANQTLFDAIYSNTNGASPVNLIQRFTDIDTKIPACPTTTDGTFVLKCVVASGVPTYQWVAENPTT